MTERSVTPYNNGSSPKATWDSELAAAACQLLVEWQQEVTERFVTLLQRRVINRGHGGFSKIS